MLLIPCVPKRSLSVRKDFVKVCQSESVSDVVRLEALYCFLAAFLR